MLENDDATIVEAAKSVLATVDLDYIVATRSAKGYYGYCKGWPYMA